MAFEKHTYNCVKKKEKRKRKRNLRHLTLLRLPLPTHHVLVNIGGNHYEGKNIEG
jgi:hypothetical protein